MNTNEYQELAARTICDQKNASWKMSTNYPLLNPHGKIELMHSVMGMSGEVGELASALEKWIWYGQTFDRQNVYEELGDLLWYIAEACTALDTTIEQVMVANILKLQTRYPDKYTDHNAAEENRNRESEREVLAEQIESEELLLREKKRCGYQETGLGRCSLLENHQGKHELLRLIGEKTSQGWAEPPEKIETTKENLQSGFSVARHIVDVYLTERDARMALKFIEESEGRCSAESSR